jgi:hypothetical protein
MTSQSAYGDGPRLEHPTCRCQDERSPIRNCVPVNRRVRPAQAPKVSVRAKCLRTRIGRLGRLADDRCRGEATTSPPSVPTSLIYGTQDGTLAHYLAHLAISDPGRGVCPPPEFGLNKGKTTYGRGGFRTCDLSRVKRALSH